MDPTGRGRARDLIRRVRRGTTPRRAGHPSPGRPHGPPSNRRYIPPDSLLLAMTDPAFAQLASHLTEAFGQQMGSSRVVPEGILLQTTDGFLYTYIADPATLSLATVQRFIAEAPGGPRHLVLFCPERLPLALSSELIGAGATVVEGARFLELAHSLDLDALVGGEPARRGPAQGDCSPAPAFLDALMGPRPRAGSCSGGSGARAPFLPTGRRAQARSCPGAGPASAMPSWRSGSCRRLAPLSGGAQGRARERGRADRPRRRAGGRRAPRGGGRSVPRHPGRPTGLLAVRAYWSPRSPSTATGEPAGRRSRRCSNRCPRTGGCATCIRSPWSRTRGGARGRGRARPGPKKSSSPPNRKLLLREQLHSPPGRTAPPPAAPSPAAVLIARTRPMPTASPAAPAAAPAARRSGSESRPSGGRRGKQAPATREAGQIPRGAWAVGPKR